MDRYPQGTDVSARALHPQRRPNLLRIGAAKSGTTWLAGVLGVHPEIFMPPQKELNALYYDDLDERLPEYEAYFLNAGAAPIRCDFSVRYLASSNAPAAAARLVPDATILAILRNPVDQVQSHYWHLRRQNFHQPQPVTETPTVLEALDRFPKLLLEPALYAKHLHRWAALFPRSRIILLRYEDVTADINGNLKGLCEQLGVAPFNFAAAAEASRTNTRRGVEPRRGALGRVYPHVYTAVTRGPFRWLKGIIGVAGAETLKRRLRLREIAEVVFFKSGYPRLGLVERTELRKRFAADMAALERDFGVDTAPWRNGV